MQGIALSERHRGHVRLPQYFNPAVTGPSLLDALKAERIRERIAGCAQ